MGTMKNIVNPLFSEFIVVLSITLALYLYGLDMQVLGKIFFFVGISTLFAQHQKTDKHH
jgi:hypothetical protein